MSVAPSEPVTLSTFLSRGVNVVLELQVSVMRNVSAHTAHHVLWCFVALNQKFYCLHKALIVELHQILKLFDLFGYIFG